MSDSRGWWDESGRHALARLGVATAKPKQTPGQPQIVKPNPQSAKSPLDAPKMPGEPDKKQVIKNTRPEKLNFLDNGIQNKMHELDHDLKRAWNMEDTERIKTLTADIRKKYDALKYRMLEFTASRPIPDWVKKTWYGNENWDGQGQVGGIIAQLETEINKPKPDTNEVKRIQLELRGMTMLKSESRDSYILGEEGMHTKDEPKVGE
jgi:hypothetical protein